MNIGQIITMLLRLFGRRLINRGINIATRPQGRGRGQNSQNAAHEAGKRTRQALNILRRLGR